MKKFKAVVVLIGILGLTACASYQTEMNANVPNEHDNPTDQVVAPSNNADVNMN